MTSQLYQQWWWISCWSVAKQIRASLFFPGDMFFARGPGYATHKNELKHLGLDILSLVLYIYTGWWFQICFIFIPIWGNDPIWRIFSKGLKPPTSIYIFMYVYSPENSHVPQQMMVGRVYVFLLKWSLFRWHSCMFRGGGTFMERKWGSTSDWLVIKVSGLLLL